MRQIRQRPLVCVGMALVVGLVAGWSTGSSRLPRLHAQTADRWEDRILTTGTMSFEKNKQNMQISQDAVYYLNYNRGLLLAAVPSYRQTAAGIEILSDFAERDLVRDFALKPGSDPHFLMTTASLGARSEGWSPLIVFETESGQVTTYRVLPPVQTSGGRVKPQLQLLERRTDPRLARVLATAAVEE